MTNGLAVPNERAAREYDALLVRLDELGRRVGMARDLRAVFRALFDFCTESTPADAMVVARYHEEARERECVCIMNLAYGTFEEIPALELPRAPMNGNPQSRAIESGDVLITRDLRAALVNVASMNLGSDAEERPARSSIVVPLVVLGKTLGAFELQSVRPNSFHERHVAALRVAANVVAIAIQNADLLGSERAARRHAETSEARFRSLVQNSSDLTVVLDEHGVMQYVSPAVHRLLGYDPAYVIGMPLTSFVHPEDLQFALQEFESLKHSGVPYPVQFRARSQAGAWHWLETIGSNLLKDPHISGLVINARDVSDRVRAEGEVKRSEATLQRLFEEAPAFMAVTSGPEHVFTLANPVYHRVVGRDDLVGRSVREALPELAGQDILKILDRVYETGETFFGNELLIYIDRNGSGSTEARYFNLVYQAMRETSGRITGLMAHGVDVTEQVEARRNVERYATDVHALNERLERRLRRLHATHAIDTAITSSTDLRSTLHVILQHVTQELEVDAGMILLTQGASSTLKQAATRGFHFPPSDSAYYRMGQGVPLEIKRSPSLSELHDERGIDGFFPERGSLRHEGFQSYFALPLSFQGHVQGVIELFHRGTFEPDAEWLEFFDATAAQVAIAIEAATLLEGLERSNAELTTAYDTTIEGWARALDFKDEETAGHSERVTDLTMTLARAMGMSEDDLVHAQRGALLHDIGKMAIPDAILLKPGRLTEEEWEVMKRHTEYARDFLTPIPFLRNAIDIPYLHHEKYDGTGYPLGLEGERIPLAARIFAVVDVYDALTSDRPYRAAWPRERVLVHIEEQRGTHFDPAVVDAFLRMMRRSEPAPRESDRAKLSVPD